MRRGGLAVSVYNRRLKKRHFKQKNQLIASSPAIWMCPRFARDLRQPSLFGAPSGSELQVEKNRFKLGKFEGQEGAGLFATYTLYQAYW